MKKKLAKKDWKKILNNYIITDCAIRESDIIYLKAENCTDDDMRQVTLIEDAGDDELGYSSIQFDEAFSSVLGASQKPVSQGLMVDSIGGFALPSGGGKTTWEPELVGGNDSALIRKVKMIDGYAWAVGLKRLVSKRYGINDWRPMVNGIHFKIDRDREDIFDYGFEDISGFSESEVYAVGGKGDIWWFDGQTWQQCGFPTNDKLKNVVCAGDGFFYVASGRAIWRGKKNTWEKIDIIELHDELNDLCWFNNMLWGIGDADFFIWDGNSIKDFFLCNGEVIHPSGSMDSSNSMMLIASSSAVWTFDGDEWCNIVPDYNED